TAEGGDSTPVALQRKELSFLPRALVAIGSPVGCFLALRGVKLGANFTLPRGTRYYNLYHRSDPVRRLARVRSGYVAYRIEPLLSDLMDESSSASLPPPAYVPFAGDEGGERLHIKLRRKVWLRGLSRLPECSLHEGFIVQATVRIRVWSRWQVEGVKSAASAVQSWFGGSLGQTAAAIEGVIKGAPLSQTAAEAPSAEAEAVPHPAWALSDGDPPARNGGMESATIAQDSLRIFVIRRSHPNTSDSLKEKALTPPPGLQETELEVATEYVAALQAHTAYFENADVVQFL
ncbi:MAG: hypothetical protein SGPRY_008962, partial [Prymnesium sp.]